MSNGSKILIRDDVIVSPVQPGDPARHKMDNSVLSIIYAQGAYWIYQGNSLNMNNFMIHGSSIEAKSLEFLKILSEKAWVAIRYLPINP